MYDRGQGIDVVEQPSPERVFLLAYVRSVLDGQEPLDDGKLQKLIEADQTTRDSNSEH